MKKQIVLGFFSLFIAASAFADCTTVVDKAISERLASEGWKDITVVTALAATPSMVEHFNYQKQVDAKNPGQDNSYFLLTVQAATDSTSGECVVTDITESVAQN